jgi:hypothetical protein
MSASRDHVQAHQRCRSSNAVEMICRHAQQHKHKLSSARALSISPTSFSPRSLPFTAVTSDMHANTVLHCYGRKLECSHALESRNDTMML